MELLDRMDDMPEMTVSIANEENLTGHPITFHLSSEPFRAIAHLHKMEDRHF